MPNNYIIQIVTGIPNDSHPNIFRGSDGTLYAVYQKTVVGITSLAAAYSTDGGQTWNESIVTATSNQIAAAIDKNDVVHIIYTTASTNLLQRTFTKGGGLSASSTVATPTNVGSSPPSGIALAIAVDSSDNLHVIYSDSGASALEYTKYTGSWSAPVAISTSAGAGGSYSGLSIAVDYNDDLHVIHSNNAGSGIFYIRFSSGSWSAETTIISLTGAPGQFPAGSVRVDSANNLHVTFIGKITAHTTFDNVLYVKYTKLTDSWGAVAIAAAETMTYKWSSLSIDASDNLNIFCSNVAAGAASGNIYLVQSTNGGSTWATSTLLTNDASNSYSVPSFVSTINPALGGSISNRAKTGYFFTFIRNFDAANTLKLYVSDDLSFDDLPSQDYSREDAASLPATDANLSHRFLAIEYAEVATVDGQYAEETSVDQYAVFEFKNKASSSTDTIAVTWTGKSNIAPYHSEVFLQIYNRNSTTWETLASDNASAANANFTLTGTQTTSLSDYYDANNWVAFRVYQQAI